MPRRHFKRVIAPLIPAPVIRWVQARRDERTSTPGGVRFGDLRRLLPLSRQFGYDRGRPIDRYYIERFLARHAADIRGRVLEIGDATYTTRFGGPRVLHSDVLHVKAGAPNATLVGDLADGDHLPGETFDCIILTQTLHLVFDLRKAVGTLYRILKPQGVLLATVPGISQIDHDEWKDSWYWSLTTHATTRLLHEVFPPANCCVEPHGNVLVAAAFLYGLAAEDLRQQELDYCDAQYQLTVTARAQKP